MLVDHAMVVLVGCLGARIARLGEFSAIARFRSAEHGYEKTQENTFLSNFGKEWLLSSQHVMSAVVYAARKGLKHAVSLSYSKAVCGTSAFHSSKRSIAFVPELIL